MSRRLVQRRRKWERQRAVAGQPDAALRPDGPTSQAEPEAHHFSAGSGGDLGHEYPLISTKQESRIEAKALIDGWDVPHKYRKKMVRDQIQIALDRTQDARDRTRAFIAARSGDNDFLSKKDNASGKSGDINVIVPLQIVEYQDHPPRELTGHQDGEIIEYS